MNRLLILFGAALLLAAPALAQQEATVSRDGGTLTITLPDGTVQAFEIGEDTRLRVLTREGRTLTLRDGDARPEGVEELRFALRGRPGPDGEAVELRVDSLLAGVPAILEERLSRINIPRIWVEGPTSREARREIADAERRSQRLALEVRRAEQEGNAAEASRLRSELRQALEEGFDLRQQARQEQLNGLREQRVALEERAEKAAAELQTRQQNRRAIIDRRERALLGDQDELDW